MGSSLYLKEQIVSDLCLSGGEGKKTHLDSPLNKTYLIDETFKGKITFRHAGLSPDDEGPKGLLQAQLNHFYHSLELAGMEACEKPKD